MSKENRVELLAPAGDIEKLKSAINYGADAVYMGGKSLGLRAKAKNFDYSEIAEAVEYAHRRDKLVYITANIFAHESDFEGVEEYFRDLQDIGVDALIISDPGIFNIARKTVPGMDIHISTQANNTNFQSANFWRELGASRVVMAREMSLLEISGISGKMAAIDSGFQFESFVHGAMCISYSGRCLLSNYLNGRDSNKGECSHPCRWKYYLMEEQRPGEYFPVFEDDRGSYIFNSKDLNMIGYLPELLSAGVTSLKIEGRMKTSYYVGAVTRIYRQALDDYYTNIDLYRERISYYYEELEKTSHRGFTTGFYLGKPGPEDQIYSNNSYIRNYDFIGIALDYDPVRNMVTIEQRNKFSVGDTIEFLPAKGDNFTQRIDKMYDENMLEITEAPHPRQKVIIPAKRHVSAMDLIRKKAD